MRSWLQISTARLKTSRPQPRGSQRHGLRKPAFPKFFLTPALVPLSSKSADVRMCDHRDRRHAAMLEFRVMSPRCEKPFGEPVGLQNFADDFVVRQNQSEKFFAGQIRQIISRQAPARAGSRAGFEVGVAGMVNNPPFALLDKFQGHAEFAFKHLGLQRGGGTLLHAMHQRFHGYGSSRFAFRRRTLQPDHFGEVEQKAKIFKAGNSRSGFPDAVSIANAQAPSNL